MTAAMRVREACWRVAGVDFRPRAARGAEPAPLAAARQQPVVAALAAAKPQEAVRQHGSLEEGVELVLIEPGSSAPVLASVRAMTLAACCCTRRYSVVCSGRWRSWWTGAPSGARWGCRLRP